MKTQSLFGGLAVLFLPLLLAPATASALTIELSPDNQGIGNLSYSQSEGAITIQETWDGDGMGSLKFDALEGNRNHTVIKKITNNSGADWSSIAIELLDPAGNTLDKDDGDNADFVPEGFSQSNDNDGLSFAQGHGLPRDSEAFDDIEANENGEKDYLDFMGGVLEDGETAMFQFGIRDSHALLNQPFLLVQRPNEVSEPSPVPSPATPALLGFGLLSLAWLRRRVSN